MLERGRLPGCTRLAIGRPCASAGTLEKSVSWLLRRNPPASPVPPSLMMREPNAASTEDVIATARPSASTMLTWLVPCSGCPGCGAKTREAAPAGSPGCACIMLCAPISAARRRR